MPFFKRKSKASETEKKKDPNLSEKSLYPVNAVNSPVNTSYPAVASAYPAVASAYPANVPSYPVNGIAPYAYQSAVNPPPYDGINTNISADGKNQPTPVVVQGTYSTGARFYNGTQQRIPPPPPGVMPSQTQFAVMSGQSVIMNERRPGWFSGGDGGNLNMEF